MRKQKEFFETVDKLTSVPASACLRGCCFAESDRASRHDRAGTSATTAAVATAAPVARWP